MTKRSHCSSWSSCDSLLRRLAKFKDLEMRTQTFCEHESDLYTVVVVAGTRRYDSLCAKSPRHTVLACKLQL